MGVEDTAERYSDDNVADCSGYPLECRQQLPEKMEWGNKSTREIEHTTSCGVLYVSVENVLLITLAKDSGLMMTEGGMSVHERSYSCKSFQPPKNRLWMEQSPPKPAPTSADLFDS